MKVYVALWQERSESATVLGVFGNPEEAKQRCELVAKDHQAQVEWQDLETSSREVLALGYPSSMPKQRSTLGIMVEFEVTEHDVEVDDGGPHYD